MGLHVRGVSKSYGPKKVVDAIAFDIDKPGIFGLIGTNGAGKTTTIRMILGVTDRDEGDISWNGKAITRDTVRFGYMPEERGIYPKIRVGEQVEYFGRLRGMSRGDAAAASKRWLDRLGVAEYTNMAAEKLSKGNQQKVQLAVTLIHDPELIILDEPFSGLDPINTDIFKSVIGELIDAQKTIVMSSHQMATVEEYCRDILLLDKGRTLVQGNLRDIKAGYGHTTLVLACPEDQRGTVSRAAAAHGLVVREETPEYAVFAIHGDDAAHALLAELVGQGLYPDRFELREPSLHDIFIEKVGVTQ